MNVVLTSLLVVFVCLLSFSIGVISGKGWSDRDYRVKYIEQDPSAKVVKEDDAALGDDITEKEVEMLTQKALDEAKAQDPTLLAQETAAAPIEVKKATPDNSKKLASAPEHESITEIPKETKTQSRGLSSLPPRPTMPAPSAIEYTVQVAAYKTLPEAEGHSQKLIDKGFPAFPVKANIDGQEWYRVSIGSFKDKEQALLYEKSLKKQAMVKNTFVQKISRPQEIQ